MPALECCICTDVLLKDGLRISSTPCGHVYHTQCIFDWIIKCTNGANCPVCRRTFQLSEVVPIYADSDENITALAKAISEQVPAEREQIQPQQDQPFIPITPVIHNLLILRDVYESDSGDEYEEEPSFGSDSSEIFEDVGSTDDGCDDSDNSGEFIGGFNDSIEEIDGVQSVGSANNDDDIGNLSESDQIVDLNDDDRAESVQSFNDNESIDNATLSEYSEDVNDVDVDSIHESHYSDDDDVNDDHVDFDDVNDDFDDCGSNGDYDDEYWDD